ncbi:MAG: aldehyde dehydrogenase family protein [Acidimicrobiales bacterium]
MEDRTGLLQSKMLVGDRWIEESDGGVMTHLNPATGQPHKTFPVASAKEVGESVDAAREAFESWRRFEPDARRDVLRRIAALIRQREDEIGSIMSQESGSLYSPYNARYVAEWFDYYAGWADKISGEQIRAYPSNGLDYTIPEPVGVVAALVTWNGPLGFCGMAGAPALAAGCTIVVKSPELAPFSPVTFGEVCLDAGLPPGVVNVIHGGPDVGDSLIRHPEVDKVTFTGGTATAKKIQVACAETLTPLVMELGGKSANIVFDDAGIERSINLASRFTGASGQGCSLPTRLLVQDTVYDEVVAGVVERVESVVVGDPFSPETTMGPVISEQACSRILRMIGDGVRDGASLLTGGKRLGGPLAEGFFLAPTVLGDVDPATAIAQQEIFGPVLCVMRFHDESEAVAMANATPYGLAAYVQTSDFARAKRMIESLQAGSVHINGSGPGPVSPSSPFGGVKQSGYGRQGGIEGLREFLSTKNVLINI